MSELLSLHYVEFLLGIVHFSLSIAVTYHAVLQKTDSHSVIGWVGLAWLSPIIGSLAYFMFGINRIERKAVSLQLRNSWHDSSYLQQAKNLREHSYHETFDKHYGNLTSLSQLGENLSKKELLSGNTITPLCNGDQAYPAMLKAIDNAQYSINLSSYIFDNDVLGQRFLVALLAAKKRGVMVNILIDAVGASYSWPSMVSALRKVGLNAHAFLPTRLPRIPRYSNLRNHRKILVCDGQIGFTGGTNIRFAHCIKEKPPHPALCMHFQLSGPVVRHLQEVFSIDWVFVTGQSLEGEQWFAPLPATGDIWARGISDGPDEDLGKMTEMLIGAISQAQKRIRIVTPYFLPSADLLQSLSVAALRGVNVQIILPSANNIRLVHWAACTQFLNLLSKGCTLYYSAPPFDHSKLMTIDQQWSFIGSTNWDARSLRLNFEFNVECYSQKFAAQLDTIIDQKLRTATIINEEHINHWGITTRLRNGLARLLTPYL